MKTLRKRKLKMVELGLSLIAMWWGTLLAIPSRTFDNSMYEGMANVMPEGLWSAQCFLIGTIIAFGMFTGNRTLRSMGLLLSIGFWTFVSVSLWLGDHLTTGTSYAVWAILAAWLYIHLIRVGDGK
jgi:hypothetical protein